MKLIVGLGNPGKKYDKTRHNVGFDVIDALAKDLSADNFREKFQGLIAEANHKGEKIILLKPQTFMNLSGNSIIEVVNFYKLVPEDEIIVVYDDMDLPLGKLRIREKGSAGGHNGMKSIISHVGDTFLRIKCGIGNPREKEKVIGHVLSKFSKAEEEEVLEMIGKAAKASLALASDKNIQNVMNKFN